MGCPEVSLYPIRKVFQNIAGSQEEGDDGSHEREQSCK